MVMAAVPRVWYQVTRKLLLLLLLMVVITYRDSVDDTAEENSSVFSPIRMRAGCRQQGRAGSKTLHQQKKLQLTCITAVVVVVVVVDISEMNMLVRRRHTRCGRWADVADLCLTMLIVSK